MNFFLCLLLFLIAFLYLLQSFAHEEDSSSLSDSSELASRDDFLLDDLELDFATGKVDKEEYDSLKASLEKVR